VGLFGSGVSVGDGVIVGVLVGVGVEVEVGVGVVVGGLNALEHELNNKENMVTMVGKKKVCAFILLLLVVCQNIDINLAYRTSGLTVCVTRAGAGGGTPSDWEKAEA
jgi:hypothetical protein